VSTTDANPLSDVSVVLFDFFGTLVAYEPDRSRLAYPATHELARTFDYPGDHERFVRDWDRAASGLEAATAESHVEFSMTDAAMAFSSACGLALAEADAAQLGRSFVREWQHYVVPVPGASEMVARLAASRRVGVVSNTHDPMMVPTLLAEMRLAELMSLVVLSTDHGLRKPHPSIYERCLEELDAEPNEVLFVGDSLEADYAGPLRAGMRSVLIADHDPVGVPRTSVVRSVVEREALIQTAAASPQRALE
jgi:putative hydrolase of the HAD superfamily